jgi:hypothetical protein
MKRNHASNANTQGQWMRRSLVVAALFGVAQVGFNVSCDGKDPEKCTAAQAGVRASLQAGDTNLLSQWRDRAFKMCDATAFAAVDKEIVDTQAAKQKAAAEKLAKENEIKQLLDVFLGWVGQSKAAPETAAANVSCDGGKAEELSKERWCVRKRQAGQYPFEVRYWEKEPAAVAYHVVLPQPITCASIGGTPIRSWTVQGAIPRHHCQINTGPAAGMQALVTEAAQAPLHVFSPQFLERDGAMKTKLETEGK